MALLFGRRIRVEVAGLIIEQPRITVSIDKQSDDTQAKASISRLQPARDQRDGDLRAWRGCRYLGRV